MGKRLMQEKSFPDSRYNAIRQVNLHPDSRVGCMFFPSRKANDFGQLVRLEMTYEDGAVTTYYVEED